MEDILFKVLIIAGLIAMAIVVVGAVVVRLKQMNQDDNDQYDSDYDD